MREHRNYPGANPEYKQTMGLTAKDLVQRASFFENLMKNNHTVIEYRRENQMETKKNRGCGEFPQSENYTDGYIDFLVYSAKHNCTAALDKLLELYEPKIRFAALSYVKKQNLADIVTEQVEELFRQSFRNGEEYKDYEYYLAVLVSTVAMEVMMNQILETKPVRNPKDLS